MFCFYFFSRSAVTPKHFSNYFRNFLLKNIFKASFFSLCTNWKYIWLLTKKKCFFFITRTMSGGTTMAQFLIYSSLKALCRNYHMQIKKPAKQENYQRTKNLSIFVCASFLQLFFFLARNGQ